MRVMRIKEKIIKYIDYQQNIMQVNCHKENVRDLYAHYSRTNGFLGISQEKDSPDVAVSLTSFGDRINTVHLTIESLFMQTIKPREIILWLSDKEFANHSLPMSLLRKQNRGLTIAYCEDLRSYKKLVPYLKIAKSRNIITVDDDIIYPCDMVENLWLEHLCHPMDVIFNRGRIIKFDSDNCVVPYHLWENNANMTEGTFKNIPIGVGGVLYPEGSLNQKVTDVQCFKRLAPTADDLWFKAMTLLNHRVSRQTSFGKRILSDQDFQRQFVTIEDEQLQKLGTMNIIFDKNDHQWKALDRYFNLSSIILEKE